MALLGAPSRFSVLKTDVSGPTDRKAQQTSARAAAKKTTTGDNKKQQAVNNQQQQNKKKKDTKKKNQANPAAGQAGGAEDVKFDQWRKRDEQLVEHLYEKDLEEALLRSRLDQEQKPPANSHEAAQADTSDGKRKGKVTLSLQEFNEKFQDEAAAPVSSAKTESLSKVLAQRKQQEEEQQIRRQSQRDAAAILAKEKIKNEIIEKAAQPRVVTQEKYDEMLEMKKKQIEHMAKLLSNTNKEFAVLQEQKADLESLLSKGNLKKKTELLNEIEELRQANEELRQLNAELTTQIGSLDSALEQERSKVHQLTSELQKKR